MSRVVESEVGPHVIRMNQANKSRTVGTPRPVGFISFVESCTIKKKKKLVKPWWENLVEIKDL